MTKIQYFIIRSLGLYVRKTQCDDISVFILGKLLDIVRKKGVVGYPSGYGSTTSPVGGLNVQGQ